MQQQQIWAIDGLTTTAVDHWRDRDRTASAIATAMGSSGINDAADVTATVDAGSVAADLNTIDGFATAVAAAACRDHR